MVGRGSGLGGGHGQVKGYFPLMADVPKTMDPLPDAELGEGLARLKKAHAAGPYAVHDVQGINSSRKCSRRK